MSDLSVAVRIAAQEEVSAATGKAVAGLGQLEQAGSKAGGVMQTLMQGLSAGAGFALAQAGFTGITSAISGVIGAAVGFESQLSAISAVSGGAGGKMAELSKLALQLGKDTSFSAAEAANGIEELIKAGVSIETIMSGGAKGALDLAAAGAVSVGEAAEIASNAVNAFGTEAAAFAGGPGAFLARASDLIAGAANASAIDVGEFKYSLSAAGAVAATVGLGMEDLTTAIAMLGNAGIKGSDAGTSLKVMLMNLQPSTKAQVAEFQRLGLATIDNNAALDQLKAALMGSAEGQKELERHQKAGTLTAENLYKSADKLGLSVVQGTTSFERWLAVTHNMGNAFFDANGKVKPMEEIAGALAVAMKDLTEQERLASLEILFGADAVRAAAIIAKQGAEGYRSLNAEINKVTAADVASERLNNLKGSLEQLSGSGETLAIMIASGLVPALRQLVDWGTQGLNALITGIELLPNLMEVFRQAFEGQDVRTEMAEIFDNIGIGEGLSSAIHNATGMVGDAWRTLQQVFANEWSPDASIHPVINALGGIATYVRDGVLPALRGFADGLSIAFGQAMTQLQPTFDVLSRAGAAMMDMFGRIGQRLSEMGVNLSASDTYFNVAVGTWRIASTVLGGLVTVINATAVGVEALVGFLRDNQTVATALAAVLGGLATNWAFMNTVALASAVATQAVTVASTAFRVAMLAVNAVMAANPIGLIVTAIGALVAAFIYAYNTSDEFRAVVDSTWEAVKVAFAVGVEYAKVAIDYLIEAWQNMPSSWDEVWAMIQAATGVAVEYLTQALQAGWDLILVGLDYLWQGMQSAMAAGWQMVQDLWQSALDYVAELFQSVLDTLFTRETQAKFGILMGVLGQLWTAVQLLFSTYLTQVSETVTATWTTITDTTNTVWTAISEFFATTWGVISGTFTTVTGAIMSVLTTTWETISTEVSTVWTAISETISTTWETIQTTVDGALNAVWSLVTSKGSEIVTGISNWLGDIVTNFNNQVDIWKQAGSDMAGALMSAIKDAVNTAAQGIIDSITGVAQRALEGVRSLLPGNGRGSGGVLNGIDIDRIAAEEGLAGGGALLRSLIEQESQGNHGARSGAGAIGLTQLMPGTAAAMGIDPYDPVQNVRGGARYLRQMLEARNGNLEEALIAYNAGPGGGSPRESQEYARRVIAGIGNMQRGQALQNLDLSMDQTVWGQQAGLSMSEAQSVCGPYAAFLFAQATGRTPNRTEAIQLARESGWGIWGMGGTGNFMNLLSAYGVSAVRDATPSDAEAQGALMAGSPVAFSTARHYFMAQGYDPTTGQYDLGATGTTMAGYGGQRFMTYEQIAQVGGGMQDLIVLAGQMGSALTQASATGGQALQGLLVSTTTLADGSTVAITQMGDQMYATIVDAAGNTVAQYGGVIQQLPSLTAAASDGVTQSFNLMGENALVSVTNMGEGIMTTTTDAMGNTVATITSSNGEILNQYATLANGATFSIQDMNVKSTTAIDEMSGNITRTVTDMNGNVITTVTDTNGQVVSQYVTMGQTLSATAAATATDLVTQNAQMGTKLVSDTTNAAGITVEKYREMNGDIVTIVTDQNGKVLADFTTTHDQIIQGTDKTHTELLATTTDAMGRTVEVYREKSGEIVSIVVDDGGKIVDEFESIGDEAAASTDPVEEFYESLEDVPKISLRDVVKEFKSLEDVVASVEDAAKDAFDALEDAWSMKDKSKDGKSKDKGKAAGGYFAAGDEFWVGENGPERVRFDAPGRVFDNNDSFDAGILGSGMVPGRRGMVQSVENHYHITLDQEIQAQASPDDLQAYTERAIRKIATEWFQ